MERMEIIWSSVPDAALVILFGNHSHALVTVGRRWEMQLLSEWRRGG